MAEHLDQIHLIVPDLPGHGHSSHQVLPGFYQIQDYVIALMLFLDQLGYERVSVVGHSLGAIVSGLWSLADPRIRNLVWIDAIGGLSRDESESAQSFTEAIHALARFSPRKPSYATFEQAVEARMTGLLPVVRQASELLCQRGLMQVEGRWTWRSDKTLTLPNPIRHNEKGICNLLEGIRIPVSLFIARDGWLAENEEMLNGRIASMRSIRTQVVSGGHHCHMEEQAEYLAECLQKEFTE